MVKMGHPCTWDSVRFCRLQIQNRCLWESLNLLLIVFFYFFIGIVLNSLNCIFFLREHQNEKASSMDSSVNYQLRERERTFCSNYACGGFFSFNFSTSCAKSSIPARRAQSLKRCYFLPNFLSLPSAAARLPLVIHGITLNYVLFIKKIT